MLTRTFRIFFFLKKKKKKKKKKGRRRRRSRLKKRKKKRKRNALTYQVTINTIKGHLSYQKLGKYSWPLRWLSSTHAFHEFSSQRLSQWLQKSVRTWGMGLFMASIGEVSLKGNSHLV
jgi:hypothetical protein